MDSSPNFNNYTLDELLDVQNNIDSEPYPESAKEIELAISNKINDPAAKAEIEKQEESTKYSTFGPRLWASIIDGFGFVIKRNTRQQRTATITNPFIKMS